MKLFSRILSGALLGVIGTPLAFPEDIPLKNWTVPQYSLGGDRKAVDVTPPRAFIGVRPCRIIDTRGGAPLGGGILTDSEARNFTVTGICGLPAGTDAISANFTVTGSPAAPPGAFILAYPTGNPPSPIVSLLNFEAGQTIANGAIVPLDGSGMMTINVSHSTHVIMDVNGYFSDTTANQQPLRLVGPSVNPLIELSNGVTNCPAYCGLSSTVSSGQAVAGLNFGAGSTAAGIFGFAGGASSIGVRGLAAGASGNGVRGEATFAGAVGVFFSGGLAGTGTKSFIEPHPTDPALAIKYVSLEGPEAGTYFRGRGKFQRGMATIAVPETFRMVTAEEGLSVQITAIGEMASFAVVRIGLDEIVVKSSRNVEFFYLVHGVRRAYKNWDPIVSSEMAFRPETADAPLPDNLSEDERARLIANGTYTEDGRVNMETARKLGWDKDWKSDKK